MDTNWSVHCKKTKCIIVECRKTVLIWKINIQITKFNEVSRVNGVAMLKPTKCVCVWVMFVDVSTFFIKSKVIMINYVGIQFDV